jgi:hypothetical protein
VGRIWLALTSPHDQITYCASLAFGRVQATNMQSEWMLRRTEEEV